MAGTQAPAPEAAPVPAPLRARYELTRSVVAGRPVLRLTPRRGATGRHLLYTHGGAYAFPLQEPHWWLLQHAAKDTGVTLTVPLYRLAPEGDADAAYALLRRVYADLCAEAGSGNVTLGGDSAGGGLALGQAVAYRDAGVAPPRRILLFSPWLDLTMSHPALPALEPLDPLLRTGDLIEAGRLWANGADPRDPLLSPQFAEVTGLPPVHVFQGGRDLFAADARLLAERLAAAGNGGTFTFEPEGEHVYVSAVWTPESRRSLARVRGLLRNGSPHA
ncbi:alpha/beta hydrolase fold domain-containing protein [Streptomyces sclerotialus]|uniref:alpha/beta hydrolase fold domain-containing protein n=1 Tax=Streptomyces sclerotialus TaxID=1957 RepID=UPI00068DC4AF